MALHSGSFVIYERLQRGHLTLRNVRVEKRLNFC